MKYKAIQFDETDKPSDYSWGIYKDRKLEIIGFDKETAHQIVRALNRNKLFEEMERYIRVRVHIPFTRKALLAKIDKEKETSNV